MTDTTKNSLTPVLVTTAHRGVFAGLIPADHDRSKKTVVLKDARMAIYWGTDKGVMQLAHTGPTDASKIGAPADITLRDVTMVAEITEEAWAAWTR